tara:strand:+ start:643 stop:915 length:273 start_codon:yes stop_codon:yes gene_type:complete
MIQFTKPTNLNGAELVAELATVGVIVNTQTSPFIDGENNFWLDIAEADKAKATPIVAAHNGTTVATEPTVADKLAAAGLSVTDLKEALGL